MKMRAHTRIITALAAAFPLLGACQAELLVTDDLPAGAPGNAGSSSAGASEPRGQDAPPCDCASSPELAALSCAGEPPRHGGDLFSTVDGGIVAFNSCRDEFDCDTIYWNGASSQIIPNRTILALSASGRQLLVAAPESWELIDLDGSTTPLPMNTYGAVQWLSPSGDVALGAISDGAGAHLVRANTATGKIEWIGDRVSVGAVDATPDASVIVGFGFDYAQMEFWPFRWRAAGTESTLPGVPAGVGLRPQAISDDASAIAGEVVIEGPSGDVSRYFHWSEAEGYVELPESFGRQETWLSRDGRVQLGTLDVDGPDQFFPDGPEDTFAFRWTQETGAVPIAPYPTIALDMSDDGGVILAYIAWETGLPEPVSEWSGTETYVWDEAHGARNLLSFFERLREREVDTHGWGPFAQGLKLSGDGKVAFGRALCGSTLTLYRLALSD